MKPKIIRLHIYPIDVMFYVGLDIKLLRRKLLSYGVSASELSLLTIDEDKFGHAYYFTGGGLLIWLYNFEFNIDNLGALVHEVDHAIGYLFDDIKMPINDSTSEAHAYAVEYLFKECLRALIDEETCKSLPELRKVSGVDASRDTL